MILYKENNEPELKRFGIIKNIGKKLMYLKVYGQM
jgi:hypothetical protein